MRWKTHQGLGIFLYSVLAANGLFLLRNLVDVYVVLMGMIASFASSTLPDRIEIETHRGSTHSLLACFIIAFILSPLAFVSLFSFTLGFPIYIGIICGYVLHVLSDFFTDKGVKLFWPLNNSRVGVPLWNYNNATDYEPIIAVTAYIATCLLWVMIFAEILPNVFSS